MARKVKLDILEARPATRLAIETEVRSGAAEEPSFAEALPGDQPVANGRPPKKRARQWMIAAGVCVIAAGLSLLWQLTREKTAAAPSSSSPGSVTVPPSAARTVANFGNFVIDYRQQGGNFRVVMFALTVEFHRPVDSDAIQGNVDLREAIYTLSKRRSVSPLITPEARGAFKEEIAAEVEKRVGAGVVKGVYFTKFCTL